MHRGRNRSRKPVELITSTTTTTASTIPTNPSPSISGNLSSITATTSSSSSSPSASSYSFSPLSSPMEPELFHAQTTIRNPFLYPHSSSSSSSSRPFGSCFSPQNSTTHNLFLDSGSSSHPDRDYRYFHGMREASDERAFFPESSGNVRSLQDSYHNLAMSSFEGYPPSQFESLAADAISKQQKDDQRQRQQQQQQQQHCFVLGTDFKSSATRQIKLEKESETQKPLHHFFGEWPPKNSESWLDLASTTSRLQTDS